LIPAPYVPGYLIYLLFIFLPGIGLGELLGIWNFGETIGERFALAFGFGLSTDTLVFLIKTSGIAGLKGIDSDSVYLTILLGLAALLVSIGMRKKISFPKKPMRSDYLLLVVIMIQAALLILYFQKYPIFPQYESPDFSGHTSQTLQLISGATTSIPGGILYYGVRYQLASAIILVGGEPLVTVQRTMAILITLSPLIFFLGAKQIFSSTKIGLISAIIVTLSGSVWFAGPLDSGLYANFFGILAVLFLPVALFYVAENRKSVGGWIFFVFVMLNLYMSHYTALTLLPAIVILPVTRLISRKQGLKNYAVPAAVTILPILISLVLYPSLVKNAIFLAESGGGIVTGGTALSSAFSSIPVLQYLAVEIYDDVEFLILLLLLVLYVALIFIRKSPVLLFPLIWFLSLLVVAPPNISAWRFSYEAIVPLLLMASYSLGSILYPFTKQKSGMKKKVGDQESGHFLLRVLATIFVAGLIIVGSYGTQVVLSSAEDTSTISQSQQYVYSSIYWLKDNTPSNSTYLSVSDWRFEYTNLLIGRVSFVSYQFEPAVAISLARNASLRYIIVTNIVTESLPSQPNLFPWNNFPRSSNQNLTLLYSNADVRVYEINSTLL
jgi:hypothetical protein